MLLDIKTASIIFTALSLLMALLMWAFKVRAGGIKGPGLWALHYLFLFIAQILLLMYLAFPSGIWILLSNFLNAVGVVLLVAGIWAFKEKKIRWNLLVGLSLLMLLLSWIFIFGYPHIALRKASFSFVLIAILILAFKEVISPVSKNMRLAYRINSYMILLFLIALAIRLILVLLEHPTLVFDSSFTNSMTFLVLLIIQPGIAFGLMLMVNFRMAEELSKVVKTKNQIFSILAHDVRSPISTIIQFVDLLEDEPIIEEQRKLIISNLKKLSDSVYSLIDNLLDWTRTQTGDIIFNPQSVSLYMVSESTKTLVEPFARNKNIVIRNMIFPETKIFADERMITVIVRNLLMNAIKFSHRGSEISMASHEKGQCIEFIIQDHGIGISQDKLEHLFDFSKAKPAIGTAGEIGTGLGLIVCRDFAEINKGELTIESEEGVCTSVLVSLPKMHMPG
jgi:two-component system, sensor histidine kinase and response regulator